MYSINNVDNSGSCNVEMDLKKIITEKRDNRESLSNTLENDIGLSILVLVDALTSTTQFNNQQLVSFSMLKPVWFLNKYIVEFERHLKDIQRKNAKEIIQMGNNVSRMVQLNSYPQQYDDSNDSFWSKKRRRL